MRLFRLKTFRIKQEILEELYAESAKNKMYVREAKQVRETSKKLKVLTPEMMALLRRNSVNYKVRKRSIYVYVLYFITYIYIIIIIYAYNIFVIIYIYM